VGGVVGAVVKEAGHCTCCAGRAAAPYTLLLLLLLLCLLAPEELALAQPAVLSTAQEIPHLKSEK